MTSSPLERKRIVLIDAPPGRREKIVSTCLVISSVAAFAFMAPAARVPLPEITAFVPAYEAALSISDLLTSVLLFGQFARSGLKSLLVLACAYLFDVFVIVPHALSFPDVFAPNGVIGGGVQTTAWLYSFWHGGFALLVLVYALLANLDGRTSRVRNIPAGILVAVLLTGVAAGVLTLLATAGHDLLTPISTAPTIRCW